MNKIYDNGALLIGNINMVINEVEREIKEDIDMVFTDKEELLMLSKLKDIAEIVYIDYENPMGYTINYWCKNDILKECE